MYSPVSIMKRKGYRLRVPGVPTTQRTSSNKKINDLRDLGQRLQVLSISLEPAVPRLHGLFRAGSAREIRAAALALTKLMRSRSAGTLARSPPHAGRARHSTRSRSKPRPVTVLRPMTRGLGTLWQITRLRDVLLDSNCQTQSCRCQADRANIYFVDGATNTHLLKASAGRGCTATML